MRNHVFVRPAVSGDADKFLEWVKHANGFDSDVPKYPTSTTLCAFDQNGPLVFLPVQSPFVMESLSIRPGASELEIAAALRALTEFCVSQAFIKGVGEIYFFGSHENTSEFAEKHGFEELPYRVFRMKVSTLAKPVIKES